MVRILARRSRAKIPMARPNEPDTPPKGTKKVRLGIYRTQIFSPKFSVTVIKSARRYTEWPAGRIIRVNKRQFSFGGKDFCAFFRPQNTSLFLNYELFVYWQILFEVYRTVTLLYLKVTMISGDIRSVT